MKQITTIVVEGVPRRSVSEMQEFFERGKLSEDLFNMKARGRSGIAQFTMADYDWFIDNVKTVNDLIRGLAELSPFADDALDFAEKMTMTDFADFRLAVACQRRRQTGQDAMKVLDTRHRRIIMPKLLVLALPQAEQQKVSLGLILRRIM